MDNLNITLSLPTPTAGTAASSGGAAAGAGDAANTVDFATVLAAGLAAASIGNVPADARAAAAGQADSAKDGDSAKADGGPQTDAELAAMLIVMAQNMPPAAPPTAATAASERPLDLSANDTPAAVAIGHPATHRTSAAGPAVSLAKTAAAPTDDAGAADALKRAASTHDTESSPSALAASNDPGKPAAATGNTPTFAEALAASKEPLKVTAHEAAGTNRPELSISHPAETAQHNTTRLVPTAEVNAPVGTQQWNTDVGQQVLWMASERHQVAELRLTPPDLGPVEIVLTLHGDQSNQATIQFASPHAPVREALEAAMPRLREMMAGAGISLGQAMVGTDSFRQAGGSRDERRPSARPGQRETEPVVPLASARTSLTTARGNGLVDTFA